MNSMQTDLKNHPGPWVAFDLDDVLANMREKLALHMSRHTGQKVDWKEWTNFQYCMKYLEPEAFFAMIIKDELIQNLRPEPGAIQAVNDLQAAGIHIAVVTSRGYHPQALELTRKWLQAHDFDIDHIIIVESGKSKCDALSGFNDLLAYVDDHQDHLNAFKGKAAGTDLFLMDRPWNAHETNFKRIHGIEEYSASILSNHLRTQSSRNTSTHRNAP